MLITEQYRAEQAALHAKGNYGTASLQFGETVAALLNSTQARSLLDYGCGSKRSLLKALSLPQDVVYEGYDPAVPAYSSPPVPADLVCCIDVLEHIEPSLLDNVLSNLAELCDPYGFFTVHTGAAQKVLSDGRNAHLTQQGTNWWLPRFKHYFDVLAVNAIPSGFAVVVRSLQSDASLPLPGPLVLPAATARPVPASTTTTSSQGTSQAVMKYKGQRLVYWAPDEHELQSIQNSLKSPSDALEWLESLPVGATLIDVGAGSGAHAVFAAVVRKVNVFALEPDRHKRELLEANALANGVTLHVSAIQYGQSGSSVETVDELVASNAIPLPDAVKIGVSTGALEYLKGAASTLSHLKVSQVLLAQNSSSTEHTAAVEWLQTLGFRLSARRRSSAPDQEDAQNAMVHLVFKREQPWHRRFSISTGSTARGRAVLRHVLSRIAAADVIDDPFPYSVIDGVLPADYYAEALANFPSPDSLRSLGETGRVQGAYSERLVVLFTDDEFTRMTATQQRFWSEFADWMYSDVFLNAFLMKFHRALEPRLARIIGADAALRARGDALLVNDRTHYAIGPHTDAPHRLVTFLFYLPRDESMRELGTSVYRPKDSSFTCWGGPHHSFDKFDHVRTVEFVPNRLLAFPKTERSFHGVEKIERANVNRPLLINNIRLLNAITH
jgi:precorrin-6B methylase 2